MITDKEQFWMGIVLLFVVSAGSAEVAFQGASGYWWPVLGPSSVRLLAAL